jgi:hypothetical protein
MPLRRASELVKALVLCAALLVMGCAAPANAFGRKQTVAPDQVLEPIIAGDLTAIVEGCGSQPIVGYTYCRVVEGDAANQSLSFVGPPAECSDNPNGCVFVKVLDQNGQIAWGATFPKGQTRVSVPWKTLLGSDQFQVGNRGFWEYVTEVHWLGPDHHDRVSRAQGEIRLRVYKKGYTPLDKVSGDPNFSWRWIDNGFEYKMTSSLRAYVAKVKP